jgi:NADPH-dependent 2,4-dienoyl-CoA reductase/sulfur reductase-like enzyme
MSDATFDLAIVGAGPAGMAAAVEATALGLSVCVLDEQAAPGGQIYRGITRPAGLDPQVLGPDYWEGKALAERFLACGCDYRPGSTVWHVDAGELSFAGPHGGGTVAWRKLLNATGAMERPMPVAGWTLPGVMTAGAAQILLKASATVAENAVFCGSGPLLYLVVAQYLRAGVKVAAVLDTTPWQAYLGALRHMPAALSGWSYLSKGLGLLREIGAAGVRVVRNVDRLEMRGRDALEAVRWRAGASEGEIATMHAFLHQGIAPNTNLARAAGCAHVWDEAQLSWRPRTDAWGAASRPEIYCGGDVAGIAGARAAALSGRLSALAAAADLGRIDAAGRDARAAGLRRAMRRELAARPFLDTLYRPLPAFRVPVADDVVVCRCEEVTAGALADAVDAGAMGPNQLKAFTRCGMGPCQGRSCGLTAAALVAARLGMSEGEAGYFNIRFPVKPVPLRAVAAAGGKPAG